MAESPTRSMLQVEAMTGLPIALRNRRNAEFSTGPRSIAGKRTSRRNALKHGLTANPAAGIVEDPGAFRRLLRELHSQIKPGGVVEEALVHRIACSVWRLQRAASIDAAVTTSAAAAIAPERAEIQYWMARILEAWKVEVKELQAEDGQVQLVALRTALRHLDQIGQSVLMTKGVAVMAMASLLESLTDRLQHRKEWFWRDQHEQMAWLLGQPAGCYDVDDAKAVSPDKFPHPWELNRLIGVAKADQPGAALPRALHAMVRSRLDLLFHQSTVCEEPVDRGAWDRRRSAAMLPDAALLERIIRYESHGDRTLHRTLDALARIRGVTVQRLAACLTQSSEGGSSMHLVGEHAAVLPRTALGGVECHSRAIHGAD